MNHTLIRLHVPSHDVPTFGLLQRDDDSTEVCKIAELPWRANQHDVSCILPCDPGAEQVLRFTWIKTAKHPGGVYQTNDAPGRPAIEIHVGNYVDADAPANGKRKDSDGCLLACESFGTLNGQPAGISSDIAYEKFLALHPDREAFTLTIANPAA